ncbi:hypothetical protein HGRIS_009140 [Hohenbuehelia grisea]|uniref:3-keto sterol reductase n=1 Tax=Hohenbuehelia grisea TaxID=104357 RepID=A0ABR3J0F7_9AGAR
MASPNPIIIVTGANGGVGFGICHRLLLQLADTTPSDSQPKFWDGLQHEVPSVEPCDGLTLIMACRSTRRAEEARSKLLRLLDARIDALSTSPEGSVHARQFRDNLRIDVLPLDLASITSVFKFANQVSRNYPYVSHLVCNAGVASFKGMNYPLLIREILRGPIHAVTYPSYYLQNTGERSIDGLGWVWQCNVFGHYALFRSLELLLKSSKCSLGARVIWMSSLEGSPEFYDSDDWQLTRTEHSYQASKYQIDLISAALDHRAVKLGEPRHVVVHPGVASTKVASALASGFLDFIKVLVFYLVRLLGSPNHPITTLKAAAPAVYAILSPLAFLPSLLLLPAAPTSKSKVVEVNAPVKYGAQTDWRGNERVSVASITDWAEHEGEASALADKFEDLYQRLKSEEGVIRIERASERM